MAHFLKKMIQGYTLTPLVLRLKNDQKQVLELMFFSK